MSKLYHGVNKDLDQKNGGRILPKGNITDVTAKIDGRHKIDGRFFIGPCKSNTARAQQIDGGLYGGCGISTSREEKRAVIFATSGNMEEGYVYVIDESKLASENVTVYDFPDPLHPHEKEVTLIENSGGALPQSVIIEKYEVTRDGKRT